MFEFEYILIIILIFHVDLIVLWLKLKLSLEYIKYYFFKSISESRVLSDVHINSSELLFILLHKFILNSGIDSNVKLFDVGVNIFNVSLELAVKNLVNKELSYSKSDSDSI